MKLFCKHFWERGEVFHGDLRNEAYGKIRCRKCGKVKLVEYQKWLKAFVSNKELIEELKND